MGDKLYTFAGFHKGWESFYDSGVVYDLSRGSVDAIRTFPLPDDLPRGTQASATDRERYIYIAGGQTVPGCAHGSRAVFRFDTQSESFIRLPDLPHEVQSGMLTYVSNSHTLHYTGGSFNRSVKLFPHAPHYVLKLPKHGNLVDQWEKRLQHWRWVPDVHLEKPRLHHLAVTLSDGDGKDALYVMSGVKRDAGIREVKKNGIVKYNCETQSGEPDLRTVYKLVLSGYSRKWVRCPDLPIAFSHANPSVVRVANNTGVLIFGGQTSLYKNTGKRYTMAVMRHIILYVPYLGISRTVGYLPQSFRGEGAKAIMAVRERIPVAGVKGKYTLGGVLLFGGEQASKTDPPKPGDYIHYICISYINLCMMSRIIVNISTLMYFF